MLNDHDIDIIGLSETRLDETISDSEVSINGYNIFRNDRDVNGGGVAIYVKASLPEPTVKIKNENLELISLEIAPQHAKPFLVVCWYRAPTADDAFENLREVLKNLDRDGNEIILVGDTNCDLKSNQSSNANKLKAIYSEYQLEQLIKSYTRVAVTTNERNEQNISKTLIDHFSTTSPKYILKADVLELGMVDHYLVYGIRKVNAWRVKNKKPKVLETRCMSNYDRALFRNDLQQIDWETILSSHADNPDNMATTFQEIFESVLDIHAPLKKRRVCNTSAPWITPDIRKLMKERDAVKKATKISPERWNTYKHLRNKVTQKIRDAIQSHYLGLIEENKGDPKRMWQVINKVLDKATPSTEISSIDVEGKTITKEKDIAVALNHHFTTIGPKLASKLESRSDDDPLKHINAQQNKMMFVPVDETYVLNAIKQLKNGKAPGPDKISTKLIKDAAAFIWKPLTMVFNSSLKYGVFPDIWKLARVTPIFKTDSKKDANNYRPISVISVFSRMLEKIVHDQLIEYLITNKVLTPNQSAFRKLYSTVTSLINSTDYWYDNMDEKQLNLAIFLDLKKAFDTVDHRILIKKLGAYGIRGISGGWLTSFLTSRKQFCSVNGQKSEARLVTCGIPQGSCLGPLLFIIYLNDFEKCLDFSRASMYADDTHVTLTSSNTDGLLTNAYKELRNISEWMRINKLSANPKKTEYMIIGHPRRTNKVEISEPLNLNDSEIKRVAKTKSLGVMVDEGLNWDDQFRKVKGKISGGLKSMKKLKNLISQSQLDHVYRALVESHLRYANVIWGSLPKSKLNTLQRLQDRARSIIDQSRLKDNWSHNWLTVEQLTKFDRSVMTYKIISRQCPESLWDKYHHRTQHSSPVQSTIRFFVLFRGKGQLCSPKNISKILAETCNTNVLTERTA